MPSPSREQLRRWHRALGISSDYTVRRHLPWQRTALRLVSIGAAADDGRAVRLTPRAAAAWQRMSRAAAIDGITLLPLSGFRSVTRQARIIRAKLASGQDIRQILRLMAAPGCSEHHTGRALDLGSPDHLALDVAFERTPAFRWLKTHAARFGFRLSYSRRNPHGIRYEPWHWCYHS